MYGTTSSNLYRIDPATGNATNLGGYGPSFTNVKGLTGFGSGLLLASDSAADDRVMYAADPATPSALTTYATSIDKSVGGLSFISDGGLGFYDGSLYEAGQNVSSPYDYLIDVSTDTNLGLFDDGDYSDYIDGGLLTDVAGLVSDGTTLYAVIIGNVYQVYGPPITSSVSLLFNYSSAEDGEDLGFASGAAYDPKPISPTIPVPEPASLTWLGLGFGALSFIRRRRQT